jgi:hypothetical protein
MEVHKQHDGIQELNDECSLERVCETPIPVLRLSSNEKNHNCTIAARQRRTTHTVESGMLLRLLSFHQMTAS